MGRHHSHDTLVNLLQFEAHGCGLLSVIVTDNDAGIRVTLDDADARRLLDLLRDQ